MGWVALAVGLLVVGVTVAGQAGLLGGHDLAGVAVVGLVAALFCLRTAVTGPARVRSTAGLVMCLLPVGLLVYYLTDGEG